MIKVNSHYLGADYPANYLIVFLQISIFAFILPLKKFSGQSYKGSTIVNYDSRVITDLKIPIAII